MCVQKLRFDVRNLKSHQSLSLEGVKEAIKGLREIMCEQGIESQNHLCGISLLGLF